MTSQVMFAHTAPSIVTSQEGHKMKSAFVITAALMTMASAASAPVHAAAPIEYLKSSKPGSETLPFSEAVRVGNTLYLSGQVGRAPGTQKIVPGGIKEETRQVMDNIKASLEAHGYSLSNLVKCTVMLADMSEWATFNEIYKTYFKDHYPARSAFGTTGLAFGARVEVECIGAVGS
jgi:reactive intermediate/imine deaminase